MTRGGGISRPTKGKDRLNPARRSWNMSRIKGRDTAPEKLVRSRLHREGFRFRLHAGGLPGRPDIVLPRLRTIVFVHGCYWHRHRGCANCTTPTRNRAFWLEKLEENARRDRRNIRDLRAAGWTVHVVWECEVELQSAMKRLVQKLRRALDAQGASELAGVHQPGRSNRGPTKR